jgi:hypothetical protein
VAMVAHMVTAQTMGSGTGRQRDLEPWARRQGGVRGQERRLSHMRHARGKRPVGLEPLRPSGRALLVWAEPI